jgi:bifunctional dethiobiotin synthetase / adenosylmethionine---8-amino-7-oxononanoate aminotransferase
VRASFVSQSIPGTSLNRLSGTGIHSPTLSGTTQADCYRPLFLPTILIGDAKLGGISTTLSTYEALLLRGYIVDAVLLFHDDYYRNSEYLQPYFAERGVRVSAVPGPPPMVSDSAANFAETEKYYNSIVPQNPSSRDHQNANVISDIVDHLDTCHTQRLEELASMPRRTLDTVWWPFVQHGLVQDEHDVTVIDSAHSDFFNVHRAPSGLATEPDHGLSILSPEFDGSASWWTQTVGHANPALTMAAARASGRYGHVMFPQATHLPALKLAEKLVKEGPGRGWAARAFFSDNGSTGMEVALKMALRAFNVRRGTVGVKEELGVLGLKGSYHGDTIGAMDACEESGVFTCEWHNAKGYWFDPPSVGVRDGEVVISVPAAISSDVLTVKAKSLSWVYDVAARLDSDLAGVYWAYITRTLKSLEDRDDVPRLGALVLEPLVMGAGGMIFVDPLFQRMLIDAVRGGGIGLASGSSKEWSGLPVIFDEVFVGLHRLGMESAGPVLGAHPDISVNAKILTGGLVPLAVTLASDSVFRAFYGKGKEGALLHGHSYTAHAVGCEVAGETLKLIEELKRSEEWEEAKKRWGGEGVWSLWDPGFVKAVSCVENVEEVMTLGSVLAIKMKDEAGGMFSEL